MQTLTKNYTQQELDRALGWTGIEIDLNDANGIYSLWAGDQYLGGFAEMADVVEEINQHVSMRNDRIEAAIEAENERRKQELEEWKEKEPERQALAESLKNATPAVALNAVGKPIYEIRTPLRGGEYAEIAGGTTVDGTPINRRSFKVSRNKKFMRQELPILRAALDNFGDLYYLSN